jgi:hypothetical protein
MLNTVELSLLLLATGAPQITLRLAVLATEWLAETVVAL